ncbi:MAG: hypothetical protein J6B31_09135 [Bacteroidaceae bacterium]|nr:hypothetical protein [Bacteroidaceae bacterium]
MDSLNIITIIACLIIAVAFFLAWKYISTTDQDNLPSRKKWVEQLPSFVSTLGVFGTFIGITMGLLAFEPNDLNNSIPLLLDGLKTAFFTSLLGMLGSLILTRRVNHKLDMLHQTKDKGSEIEKAANLIVQALNNLDSNMPTLKSIDSQVKQLKDEVNRIPKDAVADTLQNIEDNLSTLVNDQVRQLADDVEEIKAHIEELKEKNESFTNSLNQIGTAVNNTTNEVSRLCAVAVTATSSIATMDNNTDEIKKAINKIETSTSEIKESVEPEEPATDEPNDNELPF